MVSREQLTVEGFGQGDMLRIVGGDSAGEGNVEDQQEGGGQNLNVLE